MTAKFTQADSNDSPVTVAGAGDMSVIASGLFNGARLKIELEGDSLRKVKIGEMKEAGAIIVFVKSGVTMTLSIHGGGSFTSIDVSVI